MDLFIRTIVFLASMLAATVAQATAPTPDPLTFSLLAPTPVANSLFVLTGANGDPLSIKYWGVPNASSIWYSTNANGNTSQAPSALETIVQDLFGKDVAQSEHVDSLGGGSSASFTSTTPYSILAVHFGKHELVLDFGQIIATGSIFNISTSGQAAGLSNFRTYLDPTAPESISGVPVPMAIWLFGSGLAGLLAFSRRKAS
ncbi:hypothetical protein [Methylococcus sp. EFPC2]|uniref:hypothetical protein n=1 Tax=Methylococcus sp. EFPC2 TaxID=2812648 RepID=UPI0019680F4C|nr:hypothetical protein [Methylococcus sp. EFPC2]QSA96297.1 hypothetical protein JWZ97_13845 [Methylococcus sp. EFPC2]